MSPIQSLGDVAVGGQRLSQTDDSPTRSQRLFHPQSTALLHPSTPHLRSPAQFYPRVLQRPGPGRSEEREAAFGSLVLPGAAASRAAQHPHEQHDRPPGAELLQPQGLLAGARVLELPVAGSCRQEGETNRRACSEAQEGTKPPPPSRPRPPLPLPSSETWESLGVVAVVRPPRRT